MTWREKLKLVKHSILSQSHDTIKFAWIRIFSDTIAALSSDWYQKICKQKLLDEIRSPDFPNKNEIKKIGNSKQREMKGNELI